MAYQIVPFEMILRYLQGPNCMAFQIYFCTVVQRFGATTDI